MEMLSTVETLSTVEVLETIFICISCLFLAETVVAIAFMGLTVGTAHIVRYLRNYRHGS